MVRRACLEVISVFLTSISSRMYHFFSTGGVVVKLNGMPLWEKYYDEKGNLARDMVFKDVRTFGNRRIHASLELIPRTEEGHKTVLRYIEARFDIPLASDIFTLRNLHGGI